MRGLGPRIHVLLSITAHKDVDGLSSRTSERARSGTHNRGLPLLHEAGARIVSATGICGYGSPRSRGRRSKRADDAAAPGPRAAGMTLKNLSAKSEKSRATSTCFYLSSSRCKNNFLRVSPETAAYPKPSRTRKEGRIAIVTDVGCGMRWTPAAPKDERRGSRTAKSCGPGVQYFSGL
jgi:hypothetical protein